MSEDLREYVQRLAFAPVERAALREASECAQCRNPDLKVLHTCDRKEGAPSPHPEIRQAINEAMASQRQAHAALCSPDEQCQCRPCRDERAAAAAKKGSQSQLDCDRCGRPSKYLATIELVLFPVDEVPAHDTRIEIKNEYRCVECVMRELTDPKFAPGLNPRDAT